MLKTTSAIAVILLASAAGCRVSEQPEQDVDAPPVTAPTTAFPTPHGRLEPNPGFLYGRITTNGEGTYEGRLRWAGDEEAFWGDFFNGVKDENPWVHRLPPEQQEASRPFELFGFKFDPWGRLDDFQRPFMARFGDIVRIDAEGYFTARVTLKSGTVFTLDRMKSNDFDDGLRVWDVGRGVVDLRPQQIHTIELLPAAPFAGAPSRLHGTVRTRQGDFSGYLQWNRKESVGTDTLDGRVEGREFSLRFDAIGSIAHHSPDSSLVTLLDGREIVIAGSQEAGQGNRGIYVDDLRYGRVLISWEAFDRVDFSSSESGPAYDDFPPGRSITGSVTTRTGRRMTGRLVYDLDESETTETLDAPSHGVAYTIPFGLIASIVLPDPDAGGVRRSWVTLHSGEAVELELTGDLSEDNGGVLVFVDGRQTPEYVPWTDIKQIDLERPAAMSQPRGEG